MAGCIVAPHPLATLSGDSNLSMVLELEDLALMTAQRIQELIAGTPPGEMRGYLFGVLDMRITIDACMRRPA